MNLIDITRDFATEEQCLAYLEKARWPEGVACLACESKRLSKFTAKGRVRKGKEGPIRHLYQCLECGRQFTATVGTIFNDSHLPLTKWFLAIALLCDAKKSVSANQLKRHLGVQYKTAWYLAHRIRQAMTGETAIFSGVVEVDETYVGGKYDERRKRDPWKKEMVVGMIQRRETPQTTSKVRTLHVKDYEKRALVGIVRENVAPGADVYTDESPRYRKLGPDYQHEVVKHIDREWVRGTVHTNGIENYWSLFKRGVIGSFHKVSIKHLGRYLNEFTYRFNRRDAADLFAMTIKGLLIQAALTYAALTGDGQTDRASGL